jgi:hypothetical protein
MGIRQMLERRKIRTVFGEYVSPEQMEKVMHELPRIEPLETRHFQYVMVLADDANAREVPAMIQKIVETVLQHKATVSDITSGLVVAILGVPFETDNSAAARQKLVDALLRESSIRVRIVHGECDGAVGNLGGPKRFSYSQVIPRFSAILKNLLATEFGTAVEIP